MAMRKLNYTVTVYKNTGFNGLDIPLSGAVLENAVSTTYQDTYYLREDFDKPQISINDNYHNLADVDYVKLVSNDTIGPNTFYYFAVPRAAAGNTTVLSLELDALTTMGGAGSLNYISGWQERGHIPKTDDTLFSNLAPEDWLPIEPLENTEPIVVTNPHHYDDEHPEEDLQIVLSNINIGLIGANSLYRYLNDPTSSLEVIKGVTVDPTTHETEEEEMYIPSISVCDYNTTFKTNPLDMNGQSSTVAALDVPNVVAFDVKHRNVQEGLKLLFSCGQLQLQGSYTIPKEYVYKQPHGNNDQVSGLQTDVNGAGGYIKISGFHFIDEIAQLLFDYAIPNYTVKNKKCYAMYRNISLANMASGSVVTKPIYEIDSGVGRYPRIYCWADAVSTGKPYAKFMTVVGNKTPFADVVEGSNWINNQILMEGASGSLWNSINNSFANQNVDREISRLEMELGYAKRDYGVSAELLNMSQEEAKFRHSFEPYLNAGNATIGAYTDIASGNMKIGRGYQVGKAASDIFYYQNFDRRQELEQQRMMEELFKMDEVYGYNMQPLLQQINENKIGILRSNGVVAPTTYFQPEPNLAMYGYNKFVVYETRMKDYDLISLDMYFQRFGYNGLHKPLTAASFNCREYYSYVQAYDINIKAPSTSYGLRIRTKAISQLNKGVRVWKVLPDAQYYELN